LQWEIFFNEVEKGAVDDVGHAEHDGRTPIIYICAKARLVHSVPKFFIPLTNRYLPNIIFPHEIETSDRPIPMFVPHMSFGPLGLLPTSMPIFDLSLL
jgi:hypothetical protein